MARVRVRVILYWYDTALYDDGSRTLLPNVLDEK